MQTIDMERLTSLNDGRPANLPASRDNFVVPRFAKGLELNPHTPARKKC
jgi:hypothetical protein